jgi:hypothetical protein
MGSSEREDVLDGREREIFHNFCKIAPDESNTQKHRVIRKGVFGARQPFVLTL